MADVLVPTRDDILLNSTGTGTIGRSCVFKSSDRFIVDGHVTALTPVDSVTNSRWFDSILRSWYGQNFLETRCYSGSTNQVELSTSHLCRGTVATPPLAEQEAIALLVEVADTLLRNTEQLVAKLKLVKQGLLHDLLTRGIDDNDELRDPDRHPEQFKNSPLGRIPAPWSATRLAQVAEVERGRFTHRPRNDPAFYGGDYPFIQTGDVAAAEGGLIWSSSQTLNLRGVQVSREFPAGTIAVTIAANIADTAILAVPMYFPDSVVGINSHLSSCSRYLELCIRMAKPMLEARAPQSAQKNINLQDLRPLVIPLPPLEEQIAIVDVYESIHLRIHSETLAVSKLRLLKQALMDDLLTGRVRVTPLLEGQL